MDAVIRAFVRGFRKDDSWLGRPTIGTLVNFVRGEARSIFSEATKNASKPTNFEIDAPI